MLKINKRTIIDVPLLKSSMYMLQDLKTREYQLWNLNIYMPESSRLLWLSSVSHLTTIIQIMIKDCTLEHLHERQIIKIPPEEGKVFGWNFCPLIMLTNNNDNNDNNGNTKVEELYFIYNSIVFVLIIRIRKIITIDIRIPNQHLGLDQLIPLSSLPQTILNLC